ncbi:hypothetical protein DN588_00600 [Enterobacter cloacae]|nr:hypothetical protein DN588_00600 [Enterobacter cloacae]
MKTLTIGWLNKCRCGNKSHTVKTARGNNAGLWDDDAVKCNSCGRGGVIQVCEGQARVLWETDEEMAEGKTMSKITKERIEPVIERLEHYATNVKWTNVQAAKDMLIAVDAMRRLLASLEAEAGVNHEPVAWQYTEYVYVSGLGYLWREKLDCEFPGAECETLKNVVPLYTSPPAPVAVPDDFLCMLTGRAKYLRDKGEIKSPELLERAAAMLQGADGNSPVIPDGWVMLPAEPTQAMMNAWLSEVANWRGHAAGYRAMIAAAPLQEVK